MLTRSNKHIELSKRTEDGAVTYPTYQLGSNDRQMNTRSTAGSSKNKPTNEVCVGQQQQWADGRGLLWGGGIQPQRVKAVRLNMGAWRMQDCH